MSPISWRWRSPSRLPPPPPARRSCCPIEREFTHVLATHCIPRRCASLVFEASHTNICRRCTRTRSRRSSTNKSVRMRRRGARDLFVCRVTSDGTDGTKQLPADCCRVSGFDYSRCVNIFRRLSIGRVERRLRLVNGVFSPPSFCH